MGYTKVWMKGTTVVIVGSGARRCKHEHLLEECGFKIITKFYSNGQPTPVDGCGWRGDKYFITNDRIAKMQRIMDGVDAPFMAIVMETRRNAGIKANKNRSKREKLVIGKKLTKHQVSLLSCPECGKMLKVKVRNRWEKVNTGHDMIQVVEATCCRIRYRLHDTHGANGCLRVDIRNAISRGVAAYTAIVDSLPDEIQFIAGVTK